MGSLRPWSLPASVISRAPGLKLVVETLISSLKPIGNIVLICCAFFIIFGILGVQVRGSWAGQAVGRACGWRRDSKLLSSLWTLCQLTWGLRQPWWNSRGPCQQ